MIVGLDVGGTKILGVALDGDGQVVAEQRVATPERASQLVDALARLARDLDDAPTALGVGIAGLIGRDGRVRTSPHLPGVEELDLPRQLGDALSVPVHVDNDANVAAWAEARMGAGRGVANLVTITVGTGIGAGVIVEGRLLRGAHGFAGEPGHMIVDRRGDGHVTGLPGAWEMYASGSALGRLTRDLGMGTLGEDLVGQIRKGGSRGRLAAEAFDRHCRELAVGVANLVTLLDPELVVVGGGVSSIGEPLRVGILAHLPSLCFGWDHRRDLSLRLAELGERAGAMGAALLAADLATGRDRV